MRSNNMGTKAIAFGEVRFTQVKIQATDLAALAHFYELALGCEVVLPSTTLPGPASRAVGTDEPVDILVLKLPGTDQTTLELISAGADGGKGMLTFYVDDVEVVARSVVDAGGAYHGDVAEFEGPGGARFRSVFMCDPEGNVVDLFTKVG